MTLHISFEQHLLNALKDSELKEEYDALDLEYQLRCALIEARISNKITQQELSRKTGITQTDISRIENGVRNPSLSMVIRLANALDMRLVLESAKPDSSNNNTIQISK